SESIGRTDWFWGLKVRWKEMPSLPQSLNRHVKKLQVISLIMLLIQLVAAVPARCQSQSWDYKARERSQQAASAGLTALTKGLVDQAVASLIVATNADTNDPLPFHLLGLAPAMKGRSDQSLDALRKSYRLS